MENLTNGNGKMEDIFYAALALHVAHKPLNKENIRIVLRSAGTPVDEPSLDIIGAFIESLKDSHGQDDSSSDTRILKLLTAVLSQPDGPAAQLETLRSAIKSPQKGRYVYGITAGGREVRLGPIGIDGSEVYTITYQDLGALVHCCPAEPYQSLDDEKVKGWVKSHQGVLDIARKQFEIIIPMGFDTIIKSGDDSISPEQVVRDWLKSDFARFHTLISQIEGRDEFAVQISYIPSVINISGWEQSEEVRNIRQQMSKKSPGIAYIYKQKLEKALKADVEKRMDVWFKEFFNQVSKHADDIVIEKNRKLDDDKVMLLNLSCLVAKEKVNSLGDELEKINKLEGFSVHFSGPWPPYTFVAKPIAAGGKEVSNETH
jgi:hypothetical protein